MWYRTEQQVYTELMIAKELLEIYMCGRSVPPDAAGMSRAAKMRKLADEYGRRKGMRVNTNWKGDRASGLYLEFTYESLEEN